jgi:hypothetical protein
MEKEQDHQELEFGIEFIRVAMRLQQENEGWRLQRMNQRMIQELCRPWLSSSGRI